MRPNKLSRSEIISHCAKQFKQHGYAGTSMQMLAQSCGLTKGAFYYYYNNKEQLLMDILQEIHQQLIGYLNPIANDQSLSVGDRFATMHSKAVQYFTIGEVGCLMAIISIGSLHKLPEAKPLIRDFFQDWENAMYPLFAEKYDEAEARRFAKQSVADYEGAILMYRFTEDTFYIEQVGRRIKAVIE